LIRSDCWQFGAFLEGELAGGDPTPGKTNRWCWAVTPNQALNRTLPSPSASSLDLSDFRSPLIFAACGSAG